MPIRFTQSPIKLLHIGFLGFTASIVLLISSSPFAVAKLQISQEANGEVAANANKAHFKLPADPREKKNVEAAITWLKTQIHSGQLQPKKDANPDSGIEAEKIWVIAWFDPTLKISNPEKPAAKPLVGYLITDTLWAGHALKLTDPTESQQLLGTLERLNATGNGLQEVLFHPVAELKHQPIDPDPVHGHSLGRIQTETHTIDVRNFTLAANSDFADAHPKLFAEVAAYQAIYDYWNGDQLSAQQRLAHIFRPMGTDPANTDRPDKDDPIFWDSERQLLIDLGNFQQWQAEDDCPQFPIKLGTVLYALRLTGLDKQFPKQTQAIHQRLWQAQHQQGRSDSSNAKPNNARSLNNGEGGLAHFFIVRKDGSVQLAPGATGEATAIGILSATVQTANVQTKQSKPKAELKSPDQK